MGKASRTKQERRQSDADAERGTAEARQLLEPVVGFHRKRKEDACRDVDERGTDDIQPFIEFHRDGAVIAAVLTERIDRDQALDVIWFGVPGYGADAVTLCMDSHFSNSMTNPRTGQPWAPGEMQGLCDNEGACDLGLITDCLLIIRHARDGNAWWANCAYHVHKSAKTPAWVTETDYMKLSGERELQGLIADVVRGSFAQRTLAEATDGLKDRARLDALVSGEIVRRGHLLALFEPATDG